MTKAPEPEEVSYPHKDLIIRDEVLETILHADQGYLVARQDALRIKEKGIFRFYDLGLDFSVEGKLQIPEFYSIPLISFAGNDESDLQSKLAIRQLQEPCERILVRQGARPDLYDLTYGRGGRQFKRRDFITTEEALRQVVSDAQQEKLEIIVRLRLKEYLNCLTRSYPYALCSKKPFLA